MLLKNEMDKEEKSMVRIITDSAADFEPAELKEMDVDCIPLSVILGGREYRENIDITKDMFYQMLEREKEFPHTSQPAPHAFQEAMGRAKTQGEEAVVITMSSGLSGTYQSALLAKNLLEYGDCHVIDSRIATGGERILVEQAVKLRDEGKSAGEIARCLEKLRSRVVLYACMDTLEYLYKGGRISQTVYAIGSAARVKPVLYVSPDGRAEIPARMLGTKRGMRFLLKKLEEQKPDPAFPFYILYTQDKRNGLELLDYLERHGIRGMGEQPAAVGAVVGSHIGPGAFGITYISSDESQTGCVEDEKYFTKTD